MISGPSGAPLGPLGEPLVVAVDAQNIYTTNRYDGTKADRVLVWAQSGGDPRTLATIPEGEYVGAVLASDGTSVFYTVNFTGKDSVMASHLMRVGVDGGEPVELVTRPFIESIALDADNVYYDSDGSVGTGAATGSIEKIAKTGGDAVTLASTTGGPVSIATNATSVFWALSGGHQERNGNIYRVDKVGGTAATIASGLTAPHAIVADEQWIYWLEPDTLGVDCTTSGSVRSQPLTAAATISIIAEKQAAPGSLALDGGNLYWANGGLHCNVEAVANGSIARAPAAGGEVKTLATGVLAPRSIAVDSSSVVYLHLTDTFTDSGEMLVIAK